jgi:hypothetical protein
LLIVIGELIVEIYSAPPASFAVLPSTQLASTVGLDAEPRRHRTTICVRGVPGDRIASEQSGRGVIVVDPPPEP